MKERRKGKEKKETTNYDLYNLLYKVHRNQ